MWAGRWRSYADGRQPLAGAFTSRPTRAKFASRSSRLLAEDLAKTTASPPPAAPLLTPDVLDLNLGEAHLAIGLVREHAFQRLDHRPLRHFLEFEPLPLARFSHHARKRQHAEAHVPRLVGQDAPADLAQQRILRRLRQHAEQRHGEGLGDELKTDRLRRPARVCDQHVEELLQRRRHGVELAAELFGDVTIQHLGVTCLVHHLRGLKPLGVVALDRLDELAADDHRPVLAVHQRREPPGGQPTVELALLLRRELSPVLGPEGVDQLVGEEASTGIHRPLPMSFVAFH
jgi:hypothetical protein